jgi:hypothetical protein
MSGMARALRIEFPGAVYHVMARGHHGQGISRMMGIAIFF